MTNKQRYEFIINYFSEHCPAPKSELHYRNPYQLLVAVILSAQCTDKRVNEETPAFFAAFPHPQQLKEAAVEDIFSYVKRISYPNNKAKHLKGMATMLVDKFGGQVPDNVNDLQLLPGVGRKTANVIAAVIFDQPTMAVDTHVFRVSARIGLVKNAKTPLETEKQLVKYFPKKVIPDAHHWLILHGRYVCKARKPECEHCGIKDACLFYQKEYQKKYQKKRDNVARKKQVR